jgi:hypothetical protein
VDALSAALGVHAELLPLLPFQSSQKHELAFAHRAEDVQRQRGILLGVIFRRPAVLIESRDGRAGRAEDPAHAMAGDELRIGEMCEDL